MQIWSRSIREKDPAEWKKWDFRVPVPIRITVDTCHFLSVALFMEYSLTIKWQPCLAWQIVGHFPSFLRIHWERLEERVITLSSFSLSVDARKEECIHQFPNCHLTLLKCSNQRVPPMVLTSKKSNFFNDSHMKVHKNRTKREKSHNF